jgi:hypothetical protein
MKKRVVFISGLILGVGVIFSQNVGINSSGAAPSGDAGLDVNFTDKGLLIPRVNLTNTGTYGLTGGGPTTSMLVYNTNPGITGIGSMGVGYYYWNGTRWTRLLAANSPSDAWLTLGNPGTSSLTNFIGTTDAQGLRFRTNNIQRMEINDQGFIGINTTANVNWQMSVSSQTNGIRSIVTNTSSSSAILGSLSVGYAVRGQATGTAAGAHAVAGEHFVSTGYGAGTSGVFSSTNTGIYAVSWPINTTSGIYYGVYARHIGFNNYTTSNTHCIFSWAETQNGTALLARNTFSILPSTGIVGSAANCPANILTTSGLGGSFTGSVNALAAFKQGNITSGEYAGYFIAGSIPNTGVAVAGRTGGTNYKIIDLVGFGGSVSTDVWGLQGRKDARIMFCPEAPEIVFNEFGTGQLINGKAIVNFDPIFSRNIVVNENHPLRVFIQLEDECNGVVVKNKSKNGFEVIEMNGGKSNAKFTWFVIANRADYIDPDTGELISKHEGVRFPLAPKAHEIKQIQIEEPDVEIKTTSGHTYKSRK